MIDGSLLRQKITSVYPEIFNCGIKIDVAFNKKKDVWVVDLRKDEKHLQNHLEIRDAEKILVGGKSGSLGFQVAKLARGKKKV